LAGCKNPTLYVVSRCPEADELEFGYCQYYSVESTLSTVIVILPLSDQPKLTTNVLSVRMSNPMAWDDVGYRGIMLDMWGNVGYNAGYVG